MAELHIYRSGVQPLTDYIDPYLVTPDGREATRRTNGPRVLAWCHRCHTRRWASKLSIQLYYDAVYIWCRDRAECDARKKAKRRR